MPSLKFEGQKSSVYSAMKRLLLSGNFGDWWYREEDPDLVLADRNNVPFHKLSRLGKPQVVNYYRGSNQICKKVHLVRMLKKFCISTNQEMFDWFPRSFIVIPVPENRTQPSDGRENLRGIAEMRAKASQKYDERQELREFSAGNSDIIWIVKSSVGSGGAEMFLTSDIDKITNFVDKERRPFVVQEYIKHPFLLAGNRKFDIRCWVLLDHNYKTLLYREGVLRTSSEPYDLNDLEDISKHITNHSLQEKLSKNFGKYEEDNELFFEDLDRILLERCGIEVTVEKTIITQIKIIIKNCFNVIEEIISPAVESYRSFQIFGFDFIVDCNLKVWLLEINGAPACSRRLLSNFVMSLMKSALVPLFNEDMGNMEKDSTNNLFYPI